MPVDVGLARLSDTLFGIAMAIYAAGMLGYAAEFAFSRFGRGAVSSADRTRPATAVAPRAVGTLAAGRRPALVTAGGGSSLAADTSPADTDLSVSGPAAAEKVKGRNLPEGEAGTPEIDKGALSGRGSPAAAGGVTAGGVTADGETDAGYSPVPARARLVGMAGVVLTMIGWALHAGSVVTRGLAADRVPWGNMYEFSSMICLIAVTAFLLLLARQPVRWLGVFVMLPVVLYLGFAGTVLYVAAGPLVPALNSYWLKIHVAAAIVSSGIFIVSAVTTVLYLVRDRWESQVAEVAAGRVEASAAMRRRGGIVMRLPSAETLDTLTYRTIALAFPVWTFAVVAGAIWAEAAWGRYWGWDPKETWSFITWVVYAAYLHARTTGGWKGRRAAVVSLVGFSALFIDYYLVNLVISGLHSYSGV